jgi:hypothetical protein
MRNVSSYEAEARVDLDEPAPWVLRISGRSAGLSELTGDEERSVSLLVYVAISSEGASLAFTDETSRLIKSTVAFVFTK